jgi:hypothetical protein
VRSRCNGRRAIGARQDLGSWIAMRLGIGMLWMPGAGVGPRCRCAWALSRGCWLAREALDVESWRYDIGRLL